MFNDEGYVNEPQVYKQDPKTYKNEAIVYTGLEFEPATQHRYTDRLTKQDAIRLEAEIRAWVPSTLKSRALNGGTSKLTLEEVCAVFRCKYNFARSRLKAMIQEGILLSEGGQGSLKEQFYLSLPEGSMNAEDIEGKLSRNQELKTEHQNIVQNLDETPNKDFKSNNSNNSLLIAIEEIDRKIEKIKAKILRGEQKIQNLETTKQLLLESESD